MRHKFHSDGHATRKEAERCFYGYCLDHVVEGELQDQKRRCRYPGCAEWTQKYLSNLPLSELFHHVMLCDAHRNRAGLEQAKPFEPGVECWHS